MIEVNDTRFEEMVATALDGLPPKLGRVMRNVAVVVDHESRQLGLLGLYVGVPLTERTHEYAGVLPDRITIFRGPLTRMCADRDELLDEIAVTVVHEIAHHFGIDDARLHALGWG